MKLRREPSHWHLYRHSVLSLLVMAATIVGGRQAIEFTSISKFDIDEFRNIRKSSIIQAFITNAVIKFVVASKTNVAILSFLFQFAVPLVLWSQYIRYFDTFKQNVEIVEDHFLIGNFSGESSSGRSSMPVQNSPSEITGWTTEVWTKDCIVSHLFALALQCSLLVSVCLFLPQGPEPAGGLIYENNPDRPELSAHFPPGKLTIIVGLSDGIKSRFVDGIWGPPDGNVNVNKILVQGRLTRDWDLRTIRQKTAISLESFVIDFLFGTYVYRCDFE